MLRPILAVALSSLAVAGLAACGGDDEEPSASISDTDAAFLKSMIPHHESAVEMAEMARERGERREVKRLAEAIVEAQNSEISEMEQIYQRLAGEEIVPDPAAHAELGLTPEQAGMHEGAMATLEGASKEFDKEFIDAMIPHHQGAIRMARVALSETEDAEVRALADEIVSAQSREIREMNRWRERWYGSPSPAGGVPSEAESLPPAEEGGGEMPMDMDH